MLAAVILACLVAALVGCAGVKGAGCYVENDVTNRSFAVNWARDVDPRYSMPESLAPPTVGIPSWLNPNDRPQGLNL
jgi:hypothetical protein